MSDQEFHGLTDTSGMFLDEIADIPPEVWDQMSERMLNGIDNARGSFGGYNPQRTDEDLIDEI